MSVISIITVLTVISMLLVEQLSAQNLTKTRSPGPLLGGPTQKDKDSKEAAAFSELAFKYYNLNNLSKSIKKNCRFDINKVSEYSTQVVKGLKSQIKFSLTSPEVDDSSCNNLFCEVERLQVVWEKLDSLEICCVGATVECDSVNTFSYVVDEGEWSSLEGEEEPEKELEGQNILSEEDQKSSLEDDNRNSTSLIKDSDDDLDDDADDDDDDNTNKTKPSINSILSVNKYKAFALFGIVFAALAIVYYIRKSKEAKLNRAAGQQMNEFSNS